MPEPITADPANPNPAPGNQDNLPEEFKGKTPAELAQIAVDTSTKLKDLTQLNSKQVEDMKNLKALEQFIDNDPESLAFMRARIEANKNKKGQPANPQVDSRYDALAQNVDDIRLTSQASIFEKFEGKYGLNQEGVDPEIKKRIGEEIKKMVAPKSGKAPTEIIAQLPLDTLPMYLENAYKLATMEDQKEQTRRKTLVESRQNMDATFSRIPSANIRSDSKSLDDAEKKVARGLGITEEKYLKQKQAIEKEYA
jgi:hypothetical protein